MKTIPLTRGYVTVVDDTDYEWLSRWNWHASGSAKRGHIYAVRYVMVEKRKVCVRMHRVILGLSSGDEIQGDHIDGNTLDNRRKNLRVATNAQNARNLGIAKNNKSGCPGVHWDKAKSKWVAYIKFNYKRKHLGRYDDFDEAVAVRRKAESQMFGEYARRLLPVLALILLLSFTASAEAKTPQKTYVALGDSITAGEDLWPGTVEGYVPRYAEKLNESGSYRTVNLGVSGWTSTDLLRAMRTRPLFRKNIAKANEITVNIGTNDMLIARARYMRGKPTPCIGDSCMREAVRAYQRNVANILQVISNLRGGDMSGVRIITVYQIVIAEDKVSENYETIHVYYGALNNRLISLARRRGVEVVEIRDEFNGPAYNQDAARRGMIFPRPDGVHPTARGMRVIAASLSE